MEKIYLEQARLLLRLLPLIDRHPDFALKGGTAINFFIRDLPRLSVDIDLAYLPVNERDDALTAMSSMLEDVSAGARRLFPGLKATAKKSADEKHTFTMVFRVGNVSIKVEPNTVLRGCILKPERRRLADRAANMFELSLSAQLLSMPDLYGGKICAALDRQHPRDLFDIKLLLDQEGLTKDVRKAFIVYLISHGRPMAELLDPNFQSLEKIFLTEFQGMSFIGITLEELADARERLVRAIRNDLTQDERRFILSIKEGNPNWQLLGIEGIETFPAVIWKLLNISRMTPKKHKQALENLKRCLAL